MVTPGALPRTTFRLGMSSIIISIVEIKIDKCCFTSCCLLPGKIDNILSLGSKPCFL